MNDKFHQIEKMSWDDSFSVGISKFDEQHKVIIKYINELYDTLKGADAGDKNLVGKIIAGLTTYTMTHFMDEEVELYRYNYPEFEAHKKMHDHLIAEVRNFQIRFIVGKAASRKLSMEIITVLINWLKFHILEEDKKYTEFLATKGLK